MGCTCVYSVVGALEVMMMMMMMMMVVVVVMVMVIIQRFLGLLSDLDFHCNTCFAARLLY